MEILKIPAFPLCMVLILFNKRCPCQNYGEKMPKFNFFTMNTAWNIKFYILKKNSCHPMFALLIRIDDGWDSLWFLSAWQKLLYICSIFLSNIPFFKIEWGIEISIEHIWVTTLLKFIFWCMTYKEVWCLSLILTFYFN